MNGILKIPLDGEVLESLVKFENPPSKTEWTAKIMCDSVFDLRYYLLKWAEEVVEIPHNKYKVDSIALEYDEQVCVMYDAKPVLVSGIKVDNTIETIDVTFSHDYYIITEKS